MLGEEFASTLRAAQAGAEWAVTALYRAHNGRIVRYLRAQDPNEAEDLASETWLDIARGLRSFSGDEDSFRAWAFTIARRRLADHRRRRGRRPVDPVADERLPDVEASSAEADAIHGRLGDDAARRIVSSLPADQAEIVLLRVVAGLTVDQVAELTGKQPGNVRVLQHRALKRLAKQLGDEV